jgi:hypothetical protein
VHGHFGCASITRVATSVLRGIALSWGQVDGASPIGAGASLDFHSPISPRVTLTAQRTVRTMSHRSPRASRPERRPTSSWESTGPKAAQFVPNTRRRDQHQTGRGPGPERKTLRFTTAEPADWTTDARLLIEHPLYRDLAPPLGGVLARNDAAVLRMVNVDHDPKKGHLSLFGDDEQDE